jgi:carboxyl-terminal processing protease
MVDRLSASASEIFAAAIQDYGRGVVMGTQTYGKGTVQSSIDLNNLVDESILQKLVALFKSNNSSNSSLNLDKDGVPQLGQINLTMAKFYRINGSSTQHKGVYPDFNFPSIYPLDKIGEDTEPSALPFDMVKPSMYKTDEELVVTKQKLMALHQQRMLKSLDYKMLKQDIEESQKRELETSVTLNEVKLKNERDQMEAKALLRLNELRAARGLAPLKKGDKKAKEDNFDFVLDESLQIMADLMRLRYSSTQIMAKTN